MAWLGADIGGTRLRLGIHNGTELVRSATLPGPSTYRELIEEIAAWTEANLEEPLEGAGAAIAGVIENGVVSWAPNLSHLDGQPIGQDLSGKLGVAVAAGNDAQLALLGEAWMGAARGRSDVLLVVVGTGIGGAIMRDGRIVRGAHGTAGAFGWLVLDPTDIADSHQGSLEREASGSALVRRAAELDPPRTVEELIDAARAGVPDCQTVLDEIGYALGAGISGLTSALDPEIVLISGGLSEVFDLLEPGIGRATGRFASRYGRDVKIRPGALGGFAGVYGAVRLAREGNAVWL